MHFSKYFELQSYTKDNFGLLVIVERSVMNLWHYKDLLGEHFVLQILLEVLAVDLERGVENKGVGNQRFCDFLGNPTPRFRDWGVPENKKESEISLDILLDLLKQSF